MQNLKIQNFTQWVTTLCAVYPLTRAVWSVEGRDAKDLLHRLSTNDILNVQVGSAAWSVFVNEKARILNVALVVVLGTQRLLVVGDPMQRTAFLRWIRQNIFVEDVRITDQTDQWSVTVLLHTEGVGQQWESLEAMIAAYAKIPAVSVNADAWVLPFFPLGGRKSFLYLSTNGTSVLLQERKQLTEQQYHVLRIGAGIGEYGAEWDVRFNPLEVGLKGMVDFQKGCYIGQEVIARIDSYHKLQRYLYGVRRLDPADVGRSLTAENRTVGIITSGAYDPAAKQWIGLAVVRKDFFAQDSRVQRRHAASYDFVSLPMEVQWTPC